MKHPRGEAATAAVEPTLSPEELARKKYRRKRRFTRIGQVLMLVGVLIAIIHWLAHIEAFGPQQPELWLDLVAGYPSGGVLLIAGAIIAGRE